MDNKAPTTSSPSIARRMSSANPLNCLNSAPASAPVPLARTSSSLQRANTPKRKQVEATFGLKDPTHSKPMCVALHLRRDLQQLHLHGLITQIQLVQLSKRVDDMINAYMGMDKIDKLHLPLPYSQLLKIFSIFFVFSV